jgi:2-iminobutanoate/2-iminopropanoate deaminase
MEIERKKTMQKRVINTTKGPAAKGPYSTVACHGNIAYVSGQGTLDPATGQFVRGSIEAQTERVLESIKLILEEIGSGLECVLKTTVYLSDMDNFSRMNEVYARYMGPNYPARTCIQAGRLPFDMDVEIEVIAEIPEK